MFHLEQGGDVRIFKHLKEGCTFKRGCAFGKSSASHYQIQGSVYKDHSERSILHQPLPPRGC